MKLKELYLIVENIQQADKIYFKTGRLSAMVRKIMIDKITGGDALTKKMCDLYWGELQNDLRQGEWALSVLDDKEPEEKDNYTTDNDYSDVPRWKLMKSLYKELKNYNKNVFPVVDYKENDPKSIVQFNASLRHRRTILNEFEKLPSVAKRNMKSDIRQVRNYDQMNTYRDRLEYFMAHYSMLGNRDESLRQNIIRKMFKSDTNLEELLDFVEDKQNLLGGRDFTKQMIMQIVDEHHVDVVHQKGNKLVLEVYDLEAIRELGCNSVWCFTYNRRHGGANYQDWGAYSTNDTVYVFIDFDMPSDDPEFMHVLTKPLDFFPKDEEDNDEKMYSMDNNAVYNALNIVDYFMGLEKGRKTLTFNMDPQPKPKEPKPKVKDPNQTELQFEMKLRQLYEEVLRESYETRIPAYHGSDHDITKFSDSFVSGDRNIQHHGAGIYFTTNYDNARMFGKNVYHVELVGNFISDTNPVEDADPEKLKQLMMLRDEDEWELHAQDYHPDPETGLEIATQDALNQENEAAAYMRVQNGWYLYDPLDYIRAMTKIGIDGVIVTPPSDWADKGEKHIIMFNPNAIKFIEKMPDDVTEELTYRHANTNGAEDDEYEIGMSKSDINEDANSITLYHGSQRELNSKKGFSTKYVLSGEGNNIFGWGLYFTDIIDIAKTYARNNASNEFNRLISLASDIVGNRVDDVIEFFEMQEWEGVSKDFKNLLYKNKGKTTDNLVDRGYLYTVTLIPSKPKAFQWYETITDKNITNSPMKGKDIYKSLIQKLGNDKAASEFLYEKGYYGITYPTGTLSGDHNYEQGLNYVIFNDKDVKISKIDRL